MIFSLNGDADDERHMRQSFSDSVGKKEYDEIQTSDAMFARRLQILERGGTEEEADREMRLQR